MADTAEVSGLLGCFFSISLVIGESFCMLNLMVATVGQTYTVFKKEAERKRANQKILVMSQQDLPVLVECKEVLLVQR